MKNVQITIDEETLNLVDQVGKPLGLNRSEIVRRALREWLRRQAVEKSEPELHRQCRRPGHLQRQSGCDRLRRLHRERSPEDQRGGCAAYRHHAKGSVTEYD